MEGRRSPPKPTKPTLVRSRRYASALDHCVPSASEEYGAALSTWPMDPRSGESVRASISKAVRTCVSSTLRSTAWPTPSSNPSTTPRARFTVGRGAVGEVGGTAGSMTVAATNPFPVPPSGESSSTALVRLAATASAMRAACTGSPSVAETLMSDVAVGVVTVSFVLSCTGVRSKESSSMTGFSTTVVVATLTKDFTCRSAYVAPCDNSPAESPLSTARKSDDDAV